MNVYLLPGMLAISRDDARWLAFAVTHAMRAHQSDAKTLKRLRDVRSRLRYALDGEPATPERVDGAAR